MKRKLMRLFEILCYWLGVDRVFYWLNRSARRRVCFHNVLPDELLEPRDCGGICFRASAFRAAIRGIGRYRDVIELTCDDGYLNQYEIAAKIMEEEGLTGTLFVSGALIGSVGFEQSLVIDRILQWKIDVPMEVVEKFFGREFASREQMWSEALLPMFAADAKNKGLEVLRKLEDCWSCVQGVADRSPEYCRLRFDGITKEQIANLRERGWKVGYHTFSHYPVSRLDESEARQELTPVDVEMLKVPFGYPYGNNDFVSVRDEQIVEALGYPCAYSCAFDPEPRHGRYFLPRMMPPIDKYRFHFEVSGLRHFLRYHKLLEGT